MPGLEKIANKAASKAAESIINRLLRNAGIEDMIDNPKLYKAEFYFEDEGMTLKIRKKK